MNNNDIVTNHRYENNLKKIIINDFQQEFQYFKIFNWQNLIITSLPYLNNFEFKFICSCKDDNTIINKFEQFQTSFWQEQHFWNTEYILNNDLAYIFTIPYSSNTYVLTSSTNRFYKKLINK
ncbi:unnamed protein product [Rotaria sp. Silwood1]|nr:unnamed protein product [Rotaria sp. Silwood1]CAF4962743.1 unnamed protein product [Rotaria sp. Silwood1]